MKVWMVATLCAAGAMATGCSVAARSPERYRDDTASLLESKRDAIKSCYDDVLKSNPSAQGRVAVRFKVEEDTGKVKEVAVDAANSTAPAPLQECVTRSVDGLVLAPADVRNGHASFAWDFTAPARSKG